MIGPNIKKSNNIQGNSISMSQYQFTDQSQQDLIQIRRFTLEHWGSRQSIHYLSDLRNIKSHIEIYTVLIKL